MGYGDVRAEAELSKALPNPFEGIGRMTPRLHHVRWSRSFRVLWLLQEMGITPELELYGIGDAKMREADFLTRSPAGRSPALEIDGQVIFESAAILQYLCETRPDHGFGRGAGHAERWRRARMRSRCSRPPRKGFPRRM